MTVTRRAAMLAGIAALAAPRALWAANPIVPGWYADPEIHIFGRRYWIYPTSSNGTDGDPPSRLTPAQVALRKGDKVRPEYMRQTSFDAFSSPDLVHWTRHDRVFDVPNATWAAYAIWAPSVLAHDGRYYMFFSANDIQRDGETGGIGLAVSDRPQGPFRDAIGRPLIGKFHNGAQPIDPFAFRDDDGQVYLYYGGWKHCNVVRLSPDLKSVRPFPDGTTFKEITQPGYVEGSFVVKRKGVYYFMWSEGGWTGPEYRVAYARGPSATGPFVKQGVIMAQDLKIARGAGHHSVVNIPGTDEWYIAYHRRPLDTDRGEHRQLALERMWFEDDGTIRPVKLTNEGVAARPLKRG